MVIALGPPFASLQKYSSVDDTTHIGTTFPCESTQLSEFLTAANSDELILDLGRVVSFRGVVFFKDQDIKIEDQLKLADRLGRLSGKPETSGLHIHPISEMSAEFGPEVSVISSMGACLFSCCSEGMQVQVTHTSLLPSRRPMAWIGL